MIEKNPFHRVCTRAEAREIVDAHDEFWVSDCGCRMERGGCERSRTDVCLQFREKTAAGDSGRRRVSRGEVEELLGEAETKHLVARPFPNESTSADIEGICNCCDDCCAYFLNKGERCDRGHFVQRTVQNQCTDCGECIVVCHFGARRMDEEILVVKAENCYGCGLCADVCPEKCVQMIPR
ncbi:MAG: 4Fe-4S dicluster domain-containing protein [Euryarchaeota archaeon]|nr:4Fe-4S dicluster domain-containing protein [Euryarchaeota archaeon]